MRYNTIVGIKASGSGFLSAHITVQYDGVRKPPGARIEKRNDDGSESRALRRERMGTHSTRPFLKKFLESKY